VICIPKYLNETAAGCWLRGSGSCVVPIVMVGLAQPPAKHKNKAAAIAEPVLTRIIDFPLGLTATRGDVPIPALDGVSRQIVADRARFYRELMRRFNSSLIARNLARILSRCVWIAVALSTSSRSGSSILSHGAFKARLLRNGEQGNLENPASNLPAMALVLLRGIAGPPVNLGFARCKSLLQIKRGRRLVTA
jgi:hypothetical protein